MPYLVEYTDTFGGEPNYCWIRRATIEAPDNATMRQVLLLARRALGLTGMRGDITFDQGDEWHWKPRGWCTVLMVRWDDTVTEQNQPAILAG